MLLSVTFGALVVLVNSQKAPEICLDEHMGQNFCSDCLHVVRCTENGQAPAATNTCTGGKVCGTIVGDITDCTSNTENSPCDCNKPICDPFTLVGTLAVCTSAAGILGTFPCPAGKEACSEGVCVEPASLPTTIAPPTTASLESACASDTYPSGVFFPRPETCKTGIFCLGDDRPVEAGITCTETEYFDAATIGCLPFPVDSCNECSHGITPDKTNCNKYVICINGRKEEENTCNESGKEFYDTKTMVCTDESSATCDPTTKCVFPEPAI